MFFAFLGAEFKQPHGPRLCPVHLKGSDGPLGPMGSSGPFRYLFETDPKPGFIDRRSVGAAGKTTRS